MEFFRHNHRGFCLLCFEQTFICMIFGFFAYMGIEYLFRGYSYYTMGLFGAVAFFLIGKLNDRNNIGLIWQALIGGFLITFMELVGGSIILKDTGVRMWDYSDRWMNFRGLICPLFSLCWCFLSVMAAIVDDWLKYIIFHDEGSFIRLHTYGLFKPRKNRGEIYKKCGKQ